MKRKIKITESQYNNLKKFLAETPFDELAKNIIKVGDVIEINDSGKKTSFKVLQSYGGQITMEGITSDVVKYIYTITSNSLHGNELSGYYIDRTKYIKNPKDIKSWPTINKKITDLQVFRNNKLIDAADFNNKSSFSDNLPINYTPKPSSNNGVVPSDDAENGYHPYEELPNDGTTPPSSGATQNMDKKPYEKEYYPFEDVSDDAKPTSQDNEKVDRIIDTLNGNDPVLQKLFFKQASWWDTLNAELRGKKATHGGITATYDLLNSYVRNHVDNINPGFNEGKVIYYNILEAVSIKYQGGKKQTLTIPPNTKDKGIVLGLEFGETKRIIKNEGTPEYFITIKSLTTKANIYNCIISLIRNSGNVIKQNVKIEFEESPGYITLQNREKNK